MFLFLSHEDHNNFDEETLKIFLGYGCNLKNVRERELVLKDVSAESLKLLIKYGIDINAQDEDRMTMLHEAVTFGADVA